MMIDNGRSEAATIACNKKSPAQYWETADQVQRKVIKDLSTLRQRTLQAFRNLNLGYRNQAKNKAEVKCSRATTRRLENFKLKANAR